MKKIGVILAGCGSMDGSEVRESVLTLLALDRTIENKDIEVKIMSPNEDQYHTINHLTKKEMPEKRNMMIEAARIARGSIVDIKTVPSSELDAVIIPGGFGIAKNLSNFAFEGENGDLHPEVERIVSELFNKKFPIGVICIAPAVLCLGLGKKGISVTIGDDEETAKKIKQTGAKHFTKEVNDIHFDSENNIVSTPAYMHGTAKLHHIAEGIEKLVKKVIELI